MPMDYYNDPCDEWTTKPKPKEKRNALLPTDLRKDNLHLPDNRRSKGPAEQGGWKDRDTVQQLRQTGQGSPFSEGLVFIHDNEHKGIDDEKD
jgi:hypothetical protein